jgi:hypothetical protein
MPCRIAMSKPLSHNPNYLAAFILLSALVGCRASPDANIIHPSVNYRAVAQEYLGNSKISQEWQTNLSDYRDCCAFPEKNIMGPSSSTQMIVKLESKSYPKGSIRAFLWIDKDGRVTDFLIDR